ncbi:MAG: hypothetical protein E7545_01350 [Ruminococcaceae bacterium]|nr:hypothetical protein [Oscillospiraceae bacterium]
MSTYIATCAVVIACLVGILKVCGVAWADRDLFSWMFSQNKSKGVVKYSPPSCFRIVDSKGKTVISDKDIDMVDCVMDYWDSVGGVDIKIWLTKEGQEKLKNAYLNSGGKEFTVYCLSNKIYSFKATKAPIDDLFLIKGVFEEFNYLGFYNTIEIAVFKKIVYLKGGRFYVIFLFKTRGPYI